MNIPMDGPGNGETGSGRILLVDDEMEFLRVTRKLLERLGYSVISFQDSGQALQHFVQNPQAFDAVVTDQTMPGMDGVDLFVRIRSCHNTIPVVVCSGNCRNLPLPLVINLGLGACLQKPVDIAVLNQTLQQLIHGG